MVSRLQQLQGYRMHIDLRRYFAIRDNLPMDEVLWEAERKYRMIALHHGKCIHQRPIIRVFKAQGKPLLVLRVGPKFVSAFTWKRLIHKAAFGPWKLVADTTLGKRWS